MSKCPKDKYGYHDPIQFHDYPDAVVEGCKICNKKLIYIKKNGKINEAEYYLDHLRDFAQPYGITAKIFHRTYGKGGREVVRSHRSLLAGVKSKDQLCGEWDDTLKEAQKDMRRMNEFGKPTMTSGL